MGRLMSFKKLLKSNKVILRSDVIAGIEDIVEKLGIRITDEDETLHPFHDKVEEAMIGYSIHVFNIIKSLSSKKIVLFLLRRNINCSVISRLLRGILNMTA